MKGIGAGVVSDGNGTSTQAEGRDDKLDGAVVDNLASQGPALTYDSAHLHLYVVNVGNDTVTVFAFHAPTGATGGDGIVALWPNTYRAVITDRLAPTHTRAVPKPALPWPLAWTVRSIRPALVCAQLGVSVRTLSPVANGWSTPPTSQVGAVRLWPSPRRARPARPSVRARTCRSCSC